MGERPEDHGGGMSGGGSRIVLLKVATRLSAVGDLEDVEEIHDCGFAAPPQFGPVHGAMPFSASPHLM
jgi:hypothetical protein